jgi:hypothetical protein
MPILHAEASGERSTASGRIVPIPPRIALAEAGPRLHVSIAVPRSWGEQLGLQPVDVARVASASEASTEREVYSVTIEVEGIPFSIGAPQAIGAELRSQGLLVLLGRDVLQYCTLLYNGLTGQITLAI